VYAQAYDNPVPGFETKTVGNLRLFEALPETELDMEQFNEGNFAKVGLAHPRTSEALLALR
jgi:glycogen phosphorylase